MTRDEVLTRWNSIDPEERDAWVAEKVFRFKVRRTESGAEMYVQCGSGRGRWWPVTPFSRGIGWITDVINAMHARGVNFAIYCLHDKAHPGVEVTVGGGDYTDELYPPVCAASIQEAICLASVMWEEGVREEGSDECE